MHQSQLIFTLKDKCKNIQKDWDEHLKFWDGEEAGSYNEMSVIVHYVINNFKAKNTNDFSEIFNVIETAVNADEPKTKELAIIGFLEGILFVGSHNSIRPEDFDKWLGKNSKKAILDLKNAFGY